MLNGQGFAFAVIRFYFAFTVCRLYAIPLYVYTLLSTALHIYKFGHRQNRKYYVIPVI